MVEDIGFSQIYTRYNAPPLLPTYDRLRHEDSHVFILSPKYGDRFMEQC